MPSESYTNPDYKPYKGNYAWVPNNGDFDQTVIDRGKFRNDIPLGALTNSGYITSEDDNYWTARIVVNDTDTPGLFLTGDKNAPLLTAFRPTTEPSLDIYMVPDSNVIDILPDKTNDNILSYEIQLRQAARISAITIQYSLAYDSSDSDFKDIKFYVPKLEDGNYPLMQILGSRGGDSEIEYPVVVDNHPSELATTYKKGKLEIQTHTIKFGSSKTLSANYPILDKIIIKNRYPIKSLKLKIQKIMIFNSDAVNIKSSQVPCKMLQYRYPVHLEIMPSNNVGMYYPSSSVRPNLHVKVFSPDDRTGTVGFAHSLSLRFAVVFLGQPLGPGSFTSVMGALEGINNPTMFLTAFIGPTVTPMNLEYVLVPIPVGYSSGQTTPRAVLMDQYAIQENVNTLRLLKADNYVGSQPPPAGTAWVPKNTISVPSNNYLYTENGKANQWYYVEQTSPGVFKYDTPPFQSQFYSEKSTFQMTNSVPSAAVEINTIQRRVSLDASIPNLMNASPIATFIVNDATFVDSGSVDIQKGAWTLRFAAKSDDPKKQVNTYIFARFWFQPSSEAIDPDNPHKWRNKHTEVYFDYADDKSNMVVGTPTSLDQLLVSPPLDVKQTNMSLTRYVDGAITVSLPFTTSNTAKLVMGLYAVSFPTTNGASLTPMTPNLPKYSLIFDTGYAKLQTTISQSMGTMFAPQRNYQYTSTSYVNLGRLNTGYKLVGGADLLHGDQIYTKYTSHFISATSTNTVTNAFNNLLVLQETDSGSPTNIYLPYTQIPTERDSSVFAYADFCTYSGSLGNGRIIADHDWTISIDIDNQPKQNTKVAEVYRLEGFLASSDGKVTERIFSSDYIQKTTPTTIEYSPVIDTSFLISGGQIQFILRLFVYPYSVDGTVVDISALQSDLNTIASKPPLGLRVNTVSVSTHSIERLKVIQRDGDIASPAYYENLPLTPGRSIGGNEFVFQLESEIPTYTFSEEPLNIYGSLYSPTWFVNLPQNVEVALGGSALGSKVLEFRTVLSDSKSAASISGISAVEDKVSGLVTLVYDDARADTDNQNLPEKIVRKNTLFSPNSKIIKSVPVIDKLDRPLPGNNPHLSYINTTIGQNGGQSGVIAILSENQESDFNQIQFMLDGSGSADNKMVDPVDLIKSAGIGAIKNCANYLSFPVLVQPQHGSSMSIIGWKAPGLLIRKDFTAWNHNTNGNEIQGVNYLIDADASDIVDRTCVMPNGQLKGRVSNTCHSAVFTKNGRLLVVYTVEGLNGVVMGRVSHGNAAFNSAFELVSFPKMAGTSSSDVDIFAPVLTYNAATDTIYLAFYCSGKIFLTTIQGINSNCIGLSPLQLVAGNRDFTGQDVANGLFSTLAANTSIIRNQLGPVEDDVQPQRVGFIVSGKKTGRLYIYYKNSNDKYVVRSIYDQGHVGSAEEI